MLALCLVGGVVACGRGCAVRCLALVGAGLCCHRANCWSATGSPDAFGDAGGVIIRTDKKTGIYLTHVL